MTPGEHLTLDRQMVIARPRLHLAVNAVRSRATTHEAHITDLAISRLNSGYEIFGDQGWRKTPYELDRDTDEELADAVLYQLMRWHRSAAW